MMKSRQRAIPFLHLVVVMLSVPTPVGTCSFVNGGGRGVESRGNGGFVVTGSTDPSVLLRALLRSHQYLGLEESPKASRLGVSEYERPP